MANWQAFGAALVDARLKSGLGQSELAALLNVKQQTVSRWELGLSRPRSTEMPRLASAVNVSVESLSILAGYAPSSPAQRPIDIPWPLDAMQPESFERFAAAFAQLLHGASAKVSRYGGQGHKQDGLDILVELPDGTRVTYQCKRHATFGPSKIDEAVAVHTADADQKVLFFSGQASPKARERIALYPGWELWDKEDITRKARLTLSKIDQRKLVDVYFPNQRLALLGELEPSPWRTPSETFASSEFGPWFTHEWPLQGRDEDLAKLVAFANADPATAILISSAGGTGKSRMLKALIDALGAYPRRIYFLSPDTLTTSRDFEALGTGPKLLICDDAHARSDLALLASYVADPGNEAKLILASRPYGLLALSQQMTALQDEPTVVELTKLSSAQATKLAEAALERFGADAQYASRIANYTKDCPLATILSAQVLASGDALPEFLFDEDRFRTELLRRLVHSTVGGISRGLAESAVRTVLAAIALLQPIKDSDSVVSATLGDIAHVAPDEVSRIIKRIRDAGMLVQRGMGSRIAPDLLSDFLIEEECLTSDGQSNGFAERVFDAVPAAYTEQVLTNLGRLDWRRTSGDTRQSNLLDALWNRLRWNDKYSNPYFRAAAAAAFYQPAQALRFVRRMIQEGHIDDSLATATRNAAYHPDFTNEACAVLWELARKDERNTNQHPHHPIRLLSELASPEPGVSIQYMETVVDHMLPLLSYNDSWTRPHTPLTVLSAALAADGHTTTSSARSISMTPFFVNLHAVAHIRKKIIDACIVLLHDQDPGRAYAAAGTLGDALHAPRGLLGAEPDEETGLTWENEFVETMTRVAASLKEHPVSPAVLTRLGSGVTWLSQFGSDEAKRAANSILALLDGDLRTNTVRMLIDGWGHLTRERYAGSWDEAQRQLGDFADGLVSHFADPQTLKSHLEACLLEANVASAAASPFILMDEVINRSPALASLIVEDALSSTNSSLDRFSGSAFASLMRQGDPAVRAAIQVVLARKQTEGLRFLAEAYGRISPEAYDDLDLAVLKTLVASDDAWTQIVAAGVLRQVAKADSQLALDLFVSANIGLSSRTAHEYLGVLCGEKIVPFDRLSAADMAVILSKLETLDNIEDYWIQEFLKKAMRRNAALVLQLLKSRIELRATLGWSYRPLPFRVAGGYGLMSLADPAPYLRDLFEWALENEDARQQFGDLIEAVCTFDENLLSFIESWVTGGAAGHYDVASAALREAPNNLIFERQEFVIRLLRGARTHGIETLADMVSALYASAISGQKSGTPGQPFPKDLKARDAATRALQALNRNEPAYELYEDVLKHAEREIARQLEEGRRLAELDEESDDS